MRAVNFARKSLLLTSQLLGAQPEIEMLHRIWADQLEGIPYSSLIDIGAYLTLARDRSIATITAQKLLINLHTVLSGAREGIAHGRINPGKQHPFYGHLTEHATDCARAYEKLFLCDRAYAEAHERLTAETGENRAIAQAVKSADDIVRTTVLRALATDSPSIVHQTVMKIAGIAQFIGELIGPSKRSPIDLFRQLLLTSYREFTLRYSTVGGGLWDAVAAHEETTLQLWHIIEKARITAYEGLCAALCEKYIDAGACND